MAAEVTGAVVHDDTTADIMAAAITDLAVHLVVDLADSVAVAQGEEVLRFEKDSNYRIWFEFYSYDQL